MLTRIQLSHANSRFKESYPEAGITAKLVCQWAGMPKVRAKNHVVNAKRTTDVGSRTDVLRIGAVAKDGRCII